MGDGTLIQWGRALLGGGEGSKIIGFNIPFSGTPRVITQAWYVSALNHTFTIAEVSGTRFTAYHSTTGYGEQFDWIAIGRWK